MAYLAPGHRLVTAWARTWAVECRSTWRPASLSPVTIATSSPSSTRRPRSTICPSTEPATAALASLGPIAAATSATVAPAATSRLEPSGRVTEIWAGTARQGTGAAVARRAEFSRRRVPAWSAQVEGRAEPDHRQAVGVLHLVDLPAGEPLGQEPRRVERL